jgi:hypothetical protein
MTVKTGDTVKVFVKRHRGARGIWRTGTVVKTNKEKVTVKFDYAKPQTFSSVNVRYYKPLSDDEAKVIADKEMPLALEVLQKALAALLPGQTPPELKDGVIYGYNESISLEPCVYEQSTIRGFIDKAGYSVTMWTYNAGSQGEPPSTDDSLVGQFPTYGAAVQKFIETLFGMMQEDYWQSLGDAEMAKAWEEGEM